MEKVGKITKEDISNFKKCMKIAKKSKGGIDCSFVGIKDGKMHGTDGEVMISYVTELYGEFNILKEDVDIITRLGEGDLQIDEVTKRGKFITGKKGFVFDLHTAPDVNYEVVYTQLTGNGFNTLLGDLKAAIILCKSEIVDKDFVLFIEANEESQEIHLFASTGEKSWNTTLPARVKGDGLATINIGVLEKIIGFLPNKKIKMMFGNKKGINPNPCVINNDYAVAQFRVDTRHQLKAMVYTFPTVVKFISE